MEIFFKEVEEILFLIRKSGHLAYNKSKQKNAIDDPLLFAAYTNTAFKIAQEKICNLLIVVSNKLKELKEKLKTANRDRNETEIGALKRFIELEEYKEKILRHAIDSIAWIIYGGKIELIRRFYFDSGGTSELGGTGYKAMIEKAERINKDPLKFALISDLSTNLKIGDLHIWTPAGIKVEEVKSGEKNEIVFNLLEFYKTNNIPVDVALSRVKDQKLRKQIERVDRQKQRMDNSEKLINNGYLDLGNGVKKTISDPKMEFGTIQSDVKSLIIESKVKGWAYKNFEGGLHVGVYRGEWRVEGPKTLKEMVPEMNIYDLRGCIDNAIGEPLFCKNFSNADIIEILKSEVVIYVGFDVEKFIDFADNYGGDFKWTTKKELAGIKNFLDSNPKTKEISKEIFLQNNKGIILNRVFDEPDSPKAFLMQGLVWRMLFGLLDPRDIIMAEINRE